MTGDDETRARLLPDAVHPQTVDRPPADGALIAPPCGDDTPYHTITGRPGNRRPVQVFLLSSNKRRLPPATGIIEQLACRRFGSHPTIFTRYGAAVDATAIAAAFTTTLCRQLRPHRAGLRFG
ncbi:hypothetical protein Trydic_g12104 [Trypoxylus dichotomus]